ncbi:MAG: rhodanese-like domain-containing protein [Planctomycetes bacterium]|nr:rhodanese-like domain-containing protein [Planctomycetota bacterium]
MNGVKSTVVQFLIVGAIGVGLGFCMNGLWATDAIDLNKNYFFKGKSPTGPDVSKPPQPEAASDSAKPTLPKHDFQTIAFNEVVDAFRDAATADGAYVFVDARDDQSYEEGHVPGALQADHFRIEQYIEPVLEASEMAEMVIVYCNGGDCEDSIYVCQDLIEFDVPYDRLFLYEGGWNEWKSKDQPVAVGHASREDEQ